MTRNIRPIVPVILCGGTGTRLWPLSRKSYPKQFLSLLDDEEKSMVQITYNRLLGLENLDLPILICNEEHRFIVAEQFREINIIPKSILLEPFGRNTAPAIALAAIKSMELEYDPFLLVLSSDHLIKDSVQFQNNIKKGIKHSENGRLVTFGVIPSYPETGYGYIKIKDQLDKNSSNAYEIEEFIEKPAFSEAKSFIEGKHFLWNSGIFLFKASTILKELEMLSPDIIYYCKKSIENMSLDLDFQRINQKFFKNCPNESIDVAVMEKTKRGSVFPLTTEWCDLGNWNSIWRNSKKNNQGNTLKGNIILKNSKNCYFRSEDRLLVGLGLNDIIAIETSDAILISDQRHSRDIKEIVNELKEKKIKEGYENNLIHRPWGKYLSIAESKYWKVKKIIVNPGQSLSLQMHDHRSEHWVVVSGTAKVEISENCQILSENQSVYIPLKTKHRLSNPGKIDLTLIEVQSGSYLGEDDIVRFEDIYGRL